MCRYNVLRSILIQFRYPQIRSADLTKLIDIHVFPINMHMVLFCRVLLCYGTGRLYEYDSALEQSKECTGAS